MSKRIVIIGGGFAGLRAARLLAKRGNGFQISLIDTRKEFTFSPWLIDALAGEKQIKDYTLDLATLAKRDGFTFIHGTATHIDRDTNTVDVQKGDNTEQIEYDCLINCPGAHTAYYNIPGSKEYSLPFKTTEDVTAIHLRIDDLIAKDISPNIVVAGAGPSGVESLFAVRAYLRKACAKAGKMELAIDASFNLVQGASQLLPGFSHTIVDGTMRELGSIGIRAYLGEPILEVTRNAVKTSKGAVIPTNLVLWCAGIEANLIPIEPTVITDRTGYTINRDLAVEELIFSGGDAAHYKESHLVIPKNAQTAMTMGIYLAENAARTCQHLSPIHFQHVSYGSLIRLGDTGFVDLRLFSLKTSLTPFFRDWFYRRRFKQMGG